VKESALKKTVKSMVDDARGLHGRDDVQFIDIRDVRELERECVIPGSFTPWKEAGAPVAKKAKKA
jgi:rhodanese-related sulfurtransferase